MKCHHPALVCGLLCLLPQKTELIFGPLPLFQDCGNSEICLCGAKMVKSFNSNSKVYHFCLTCKNSRS